MGEGKELSFICRNYTSTECSGRFQFLFVLKGRTPNLLCGEDQSRNEKSQFLQERMPIILCQYCPKECQTNAAMSSHVRHAHPLAKFKAVLKDSLTETPKYNSDTIVVDTEYSQEDLNEATSISNAGQEKKKENKKKETITPFLLHSATGGPHSTHSPHSIAGESIRNHQ